MDHVGTSPKKSCRLRSQLRWSNFEINFKKKLKIKSWDLEKQLLQEKTETKDDKHEKFD